MTPVLLATEPTESEATSGSGTNDPSGGGVLAPWTHLGEGPAHHSKASLSSLQSPPPLTEDWTADEDEFGNPVFVFPPTGVVVDEIGAYYVGTIGAQDKLISVNPTTGAVAWATSVPNPSWDSFSTPAIDQHNGTVLVASGKKVTAVRRNGTIAWQTVDLLQDVVNSSPVVTSDLGGRDRAFITDFSSGFGNLYCINVDPYDGVNNPFTPGQIVWTRTLNGYTSGATPAYLDGVVYVGLYKTPGSNAGAILAFDATSTTAGGPAPLWTFTNVINTGFFGGMCVRDGSLYASSYGFYGDEQGSNTVRLNTSTGALVWSTPSNRTDMMPVVARGRVYVSGGLQQSLNGGFGTFPTVQAFDATTGAMIWDSGRDTWNDSDHDTVIEPGEFLAMGGWTIQPFVITSPSDARLIVGVMPELPDDIAGPSMQLIAIDLASTPNPTPPYYGFVVDAYSGAGSSPAYFNGRIYAVGPEGLTALGP